MYKLVNKLPVRASEIFIENGELCKFPDEETLKSLGYKEILEYEGPNAKWYQQEEIEYKENEDNIYITKIFSPAYSLKSLYIERLNKECDQAIVSGFKWIDENLIEHNVWLDLANQWNFSNESFPCELKFWDENWYTFSSEAELDRFKLEAKQHIKACLNKCWEAKKIAKDLTEQELYNLILYTDTNN